MQYTLTSLQKRACTHKSEKLLHQRFAVRYAGVTKLNCCNHGDAYGYLRICYCGEPICYFGERICYFGERICYFGEPICYFGDAYGGLLYETLRERQRIC